MSRPDSDLTDWYRRWGSVTVSRHSVRSIVEEVAASAGAVLGAPPAVSVTLLSDGPARTVTASDPLAAQLDALQYRDDAGPCLEAARSGAPVGTLGGTDDRWPDFAGTLPRVGVDSVWSAPLLDRTGSLNLYLPAAVAPRRRDTAAALVEVAAVPVTNVWLYEEALRTADNLRAALESRSVIEQAKGILMERLRVTADGAFETLVRVSNDTNTKLRDVAQAVVDTGSVPPDPPTRRSPAPR